MVGTAVPTRSGRHFLLEPQTTSESELAERYHNLLGLPDAQLQRRLMDLIEAEDALPEPQRYAAARDRLLAWLRLGADERQIISDAYERALASLPPDFTGRRLEAEHSAIVNGLRFEEFLDLASFVPWIHGEAERVSMIDASAEASRARGLNVPVVVAA